MEEELFEMVRRIGTDDDENIRGDWGDDHIEGRGGNDRIDGSSGADFIDGGSGNDTLLGGSLEDTLIGGDGDDSMDGGAGSDSLDGGTGNDTLLGGYYNDTLRGGAGADYMDGGTDSDLFIVDRREDGIGDTIVGGWGSDTLDLTGSGPFIVNRNPMVPLSGTVDFLDDRGNVAGSLQFSGIENIIGSDAGQPGQPTQPGQYPGGSQPTPRDPNYLEGTQFNDTLDGTAGNDTIKGLGADDVIRGGDGDDEIWGEGVSRRPPPPEGWGDTDNDTIDGGAGNDTIYGGAGNDSIDGGSGNDLIVGGYGNDLIDGGDGDDSLDGGVGYDALYGRSGDDTLDGGADDDWISGGEGDDTIYGGDGNDILHGDVGNDIVYGDAGNDTLDGGSGNDLIVGGEGDDSIVGGAGDDYIEGGAGDDYIEGGYGNDTIFGSSGSDSISGGDDRDLFLSYPAALGGGDTIDGGEGGDDYDTLDLRNSGDVKVRKTITDTDSTTGVKTYSGTVKFLDDQGNVTESMEFRNIEKIIPCFTPGSRVMTPRGEVPVEAIRAGDRVLTRDNGAQVVRWAGQAGITTATLTASPHLRPVRIAAGSLGPNLPERDMIVSPNHRMLIANARAELWFGEHEVLVAAKHMVGQPGVTRLGPKPATYVHFLFDRHEVVLVDGAWTESFQPGDQTLGGMGDAQRREICEIFPELKTPEGRDGYVAARMSLKRYEAAVLLH